MADWTPPAIYPYVETNPRAKCWLIFHEKAVVRTINGERIERYDCQCGKFYWLSGPDGAFPLARHRA